MKNKNGFSLVELLVVVGILGILLGIAGISAKTWLDRYRVEGQMKEMYVDLMNARVSAMQRNRLHIVNFTPLAEAATQYTVYEDTNPGPDGNLDLDTASDRQVRQKNINSSYAVRTGSARIDFDPKGLASIETTIRVNGSFGSAYDCIVITFTRIRMGAWNGTSCAVQ